MKYVIANNIKYSLIENYKEAFNVDELVLRITEDFNNFDYIVGDYAYNKLRIKGFCKKENKDLKEINDFEYKDKYIKESCAYDCRYFVLEKIGQVE